MNKLMLLMLLGLAGNAHSADTCFPTEVVAGRTLEGRDVTFSVIEVQGCWIKAVVCSRNQCRNNEPYWVHVSQIELFKAAPK